VRLLASRRSSLPMQRISTSASDPRLFAALVAAAAAAAVEGVEEEVVVVDASHLEPRSRWEALADATLAPAAHLAQLGAAEDSGSRFFPSKGIMREPVWILSSCTAL
jgi:hypothetical protein